MGSVTDHFVSVYGFHASRPHAPELNKELFSEVLSRAGSSRLPSVVAGILIALSNPWLCGVGSRNSALLSRMSSPLDFRDDLCRARARMPHRGTLPYSPPPWLHFFSRPGLTSMVPCLIHTTPSLCACAGPSVTAVAVKLDGQAQSSAAQLVGSRNTCNGAPSAEKKQCFAWKTQRRSPQEQ